MHRTEDVDAVLVGGGVMSATLGMLLAELEPGWRIAVVERLDRPGLESSDAWNNAGTGHAGLCEFNYTPRLPDGSVDVSRAVEIGAQFSASLLFWAHLEGQGVRFVTDTFREKTVTVHGPAPRPVLVDGFTAGAWTLDGGTLTVRTFVPLTAADREALTAEGLGLLAFHGARKPYDVRFLPG